jgi:SAM-dependent methyltransferase
MFLSYEEAVIKLWEDEKYHGLLRDAYLDLDPVQAALRYKESEEFSEIKRLLPHKAPQTAVLDLGAGNGILSCALTEAGCRVWALEPGDGVVTGRRAIETVQKAAGLNFEILDGWGEAIPLSDGEADVVVARQVLHHARDLGAMCREIFRVLRPGGFFLALREHVVSNAEDLDKFLSKHPVHQLTGDENAYPLSFYKQCIRSAGFAQLKTYAFWDTVLNYAPLRPEERNSVIAKTLSRHIPFVRPSFCEKFILKFPGVKYWFYPLLNMAITRRSPGILHTFTARKPS